MKTIQINNHLQKVIGLCSIFSLGIALLSLLVLTTLPEKSLHASSEIAEVPLPHPARLADRLSIIMRGIVATSQEKLELEAGTATLASLAEKYKSDELFASRLAQYWSQVLKITAPFDFSMIEIPIDSSMLEESVEKSILDKLGADSTQQRTRMLIYRKNNAQDPEPRFQLYFRNQINQEIFDRRKQNCAPPKPQNEINACLNDLNNDLSKSRDFQANHDCTFTNAVSVSPWWNPSTTIKVCPSTDVCGTNLKDCMPFDSRIEPRRIPDFLEPLPHDGNRYFNEVIAGLTLEPGMLIAKTIQENRDYRQILTSTQTVLTGAVENFIKTERGAMLKDQAAGGFNNGSALIPNQSTRKTWRWVERGPGNAGILTTPQFHQVTNGYRAKANRAYESFLCRRFVIPPGVIDSNPAEPDLTKRQPCASCHVELEPLGNMFKRWPVEGTNFLYNGNRSAAGGFTIQPQRRFERGEDVSGLANLFIKDERFSECAVQRAFEFIVGREPSAYDIERFFPKWKSTFVSEGYKVWPVMTEIIESVYFQGGWK